MVGGLCGRPLRTSRRRKGEPRKIATRNSHWQFFYPAAPMSRGHRAPNLVTHIMSKKLAVLGGTPVRTQPFTRWPIFGEAEEKRLLRALHSGKWGRLDGRE